MPFAAEDVYVGMIAYFRINDLLYRPMLLPPGVVEVQLMVSSRGGMLPGMQPATREARAA